MSDGNFKIVQINMKPLLYRCTAMNMMEPMALILLLFSLYQLIVSLIIICVGSYIKQYTKSLSTS